MSLSPAFLDELRARISLSAVIGRTTRLTKAGHEFKACCPFHNEKSPSFTVNDQKGFYHCFGCGAHGDVIRWMTDQRGMDFMGAVKELAAEAGLDLPAPDPRAARAAEKQAGLHDVTAAAQAWFVEKLAAPEGAKARAYLATRGFDATTVRSFGFGYAPDDRQALRKALAQFPEELLIEAGLRITVENKEPYDRFRNRLMLPIEDARGRVIGFGGRILDGSVKDAPKYLNSPDTPLFDKGRTLYNLHRAGPLARKSERLVVVEGYMDVIALAAAGIGEAVAPLGTALTERQIELLWRITETPVLCFDGDAAGQRAAMRAVVRALPLLKPAHSLNIVRLPSGMDPDDLVKRDGAEAFTALLRGAHNLVDILWETEFEAAPLRTPEDKAGLKARLLAHVDTITDQDVRSLYRRELLDRYGQFAFPRREGRKPFSRAEFAAPNAPPSQPAMPRDAQGSRALQAAVLAGLLRHPGELPRHADLLARARFGDPALARLADALIDSVDFGGRLDSESLSTILAERRLSAPSPMDYAGLRLRFLQPDMPADEARSGLADALAMLIERPALNAALAEATERFATDPEGAIAEQQRLLKRKLAFESRLLQMATARSADGGGERAIESDQADD